MRRATAGGRIVPALCAVLVVAAALALAAALVSGAAAGERPANRLAAESSPYLRLHAHNPVDWYPWGEEALARARREDKPIFLSIGYSTCYWCHVMEREAFSDPETAALMNRWFVNIKVDREERPELDEIYMSATQLMTGRGGWPNSLFLTPELEPFFAGTYLPIEDRQGRPGFRTVLTTLSEAWVDRRPVVEERASRVAQAVRDQVGEQRLPAAAPPARAAVDGAIVAVKGRYDAEWGGFGPGPKFPSPGSLMLLLEAGERGDAEAAAMVVASLERMGRGAIYDQLDGGFHRYTLDRQWRIPHFEKMLYDNAHLAELLAESWRATRSPELERLARGTLDFVLAEMTLPEGPFKSAIDAETDGEEGAYYVWSGDELRAVLGDEPLALLAPLLGFDGPPNFEGGRHTLFLPRPLGEQADRLGLGRAALLERIAGPLDRLRAARRRRQFPRVDDKVLTDWNGMMIAALARSGQLLDEPRYLAAAVRAARFVLAKLRDGEGRLLHAWRGGAARIPAFLDDYAYLVRGLLALAEATGEAAWLDHAERLAAEAESRLGDPAGGCFLSRDAPDLLVRPKTVSDGAVPSGNAILLLDLLELAERTGDDGYRRRAELGLRAFAGDLERSPASTPVLALAALIARDAATAAAGPAAPGTGGEGGDVVSATARLNGEPAAGGWRPFEVRLEIAAGWHVNANPASQEFLIPTRVAGPVREVAYPAGERRRFVFADAELAVYSGTVAITGQAAAGAAAVRLTYQTCDDDRCLPPVTRELELVGGGPPPEPKPERPEEPRP